MAVGIVVACIPTLGPVIFPARRSRSSSQKRYIGYGKDKIGSGAHTHLRGDRNDSIGGTSLQGFEGDEIVLGHSLHHGDSKSYIYARGDVRTSIPAIHDRIGVRNDIDVTISS